MGGRRTQPGDELTPLQVATVEAMIEHFIEHGTWPSYRDLAARSGVMTHAIYCRLRAIEAKGVIVVTPGAARSILLAPALEARALQARLAKIEAAS